MFNCLCYFSTVSILLSVSCNKPASIHLLHPTDHFSILQPPNLLSAFLSFIKFTDKRIVKCSVVQTRGNQIWQRAISAILLTAFSASSSSLRPFLSLYVRTRTCVIYSEISVIYYWHFSLFCFASDISTTQTTLLEKKNRYPSFLKKVRMVLNSSIEIP